MLFIVSGFKKLSNQGDFCSWLLQWRLALARVSATEIRSGSL